MPARTAAFVAVALMSLAFADAASASCDLLPPNKNPGEIAGIEFTAVARAVNDNFNSGAQSKRNYDHVEPLDGITLGFGHWPQHEVAGFFRDMRETAQGRSLAAFVDCATAFFGEPGNAVAWRKAQSAARFEAGNAARPRVQTAIDNTLLNPTFMARYRNHCREVCRRGEPDLYHEHEGWLVPLLRFALRDRTVAVWQVDFWTRTIVGAANRFAAEVGLADDPAAVVVAAAYRSSSPAWFRPVAEAARTGTLTLNALRWSWNSPPAGAPRDVESLRSWRHLVMWQHYAARVWFVQGKRRVRDRSRKYYSDFLAERWRLPAVLANGTPDWSKASNLNPALVRPR